jgi:hypothetical protein
LDKRTIEDQKKAARMQQILGTVGNLTKDAVSYLGKDYIKAAPGQSMVAKGAGAIKNIFSPGALEAPTGAVGESMLSGANLAPEVVKAVPEAGGMVAEAVAPEVGAAAGEAAGTAGSTIGNTLGSVVSSAAPYVGYHGLRRAGQNILGGLVQKMGGGGSNAFSQFGRTISNTSNIEDIPFEWVKELGVVNAKDIEPAEWLLNPVGKVLDWVDDACIIVTACTDRNSPEVNLTREYRDKFLSKGQLRGYYVIAEKIVPLLKASDKLRLFTKAKLVDRLVDYGEYKLGKKDKCKFISKIVSKVFLAVIAAFGFIVPKYTRINGEVY